MSPGVYIAQGQVDTIATLIYGALENEPDEEETDNLIALAEAFDLEGPLDSLRVYKEETF